VKEPPLLALDDHPEKGFPAKYKENGANDYRLTALRDAVSTHEHAVVHADRRIPYRVLVEVLFTLSVNKVSRWSFAVRDGSGKLRGLDGIGPATLTGFKSVTPDAARPMRFVAVVKSDYTIPKAFGMTLGEGCGNDGDLRIPPTDFAALTQCATRARGTGDDRDAVVSADADVSFQRLVSTWDALRKTADGAPLLPEITLGLVR
jgi:biopolymer transport protein ExbD